jgi:Fe-S cluster assembly protein SufD
MNTSAISPELKTLVVGPFDEEHFGALLNAPESALLRAKREAAFDTYQGISMPTLVDEEWRRTPPQLFPFDGLTALPAMRVQEGSRDVAQADQFDVVVHVNGSSVAIHDQTGVLRDGRVTVLTFEQAAQDHPDLMKRHVGGRALPSALDKFVALNHAFRNLGLFIHLSDGMELERGILLRYDLSQDECAFVPQLLVIAGKQSRGTIVEWCSSPDHIRMLSVSTKELYVEEAARLKIISLQEWGENSYQIANDMARVEGDGQIDWVSLNFGSKVSKLKFGSEVAGPGSSAELDGLFFCNHDQHVDQKTLQIHSAPHTYSRLLYKGAVQDIGHSVYQGVIQALPGAIKVDAYQTNNNLVLTDGAQADTIPGLLIDADDLKCSHGATIGNLDPEQMFYLRARGMSEDTARRLLLLGFFDEIGDRIPYAFVRERVHQIVEEKLNGD